MSFEDTNCPCGGRKEPQTMLCDDCRVAFAEHPEMRVFENLNYSSNVRRAACIALLKLAHQRLKPAYDGDAYVSVRKRKI